MLKITQKRSHIGIPEKITKVLESLGLRKIGKSVIKEDISSIKGMIRKVSHLVTVEKVDK
ncbi:MAG: 50S ribosomal protein L30 [Nitrospirae bacterium GWC2_42_7]|nr:MAG: 50S ribosomal protein L30 [Nitrospirae bacterium GWC2_42_7]